MINNMLKFLKTLKMPTTPPHRKNSKNPSWWIAPTLLLLAINLHSGQIIFAAYFFIVIAYLSSSSSTMFVIYFVVISDRRNYYQLFSQVVFAPFNRFAMNLFQLGMQIYLIFFWNGGSAPELFLSSFFYIPYFNYRSCP